MALAMRGRRVDLFYQPHLFQRIEDLSEYDETLFQLLLEAYSLAFDKDKNRIWFWFRNEVRSHYWLLANEAVEIGSRIFGFGCWRLAESPEYGVVQLRHIGVVPNCPVAGLGREIVYHLEDNVDKVSRSFSFPLTRFTLVCRSNNRLAANMYRKCGYVHSNTYRSYFGPNVDAFVFEKVVS
jgi:ribosomal protein S18 acetylase RimI-like enzyme